MSVDLSKNTIITDSSYVGLFYAYEASGGFQFEQGVETTTILPSRVISRYDVTNSLQIKFDVRTFNEKIGLIKDASNVNIISSSYQNNRFQNDTITLSASEFVYGIDISNILSVGLYKDLYKNFQTLLLNYFGLPEKFTSLFTVKGQVNNINNGIFDASAMVNLMHSKTLNSKGEYINDVSGSITIENVNGLLRYACLYNPFNNRTNETIQNGFIENDLIYIPTGTKVTLVANIINSDLSNNNIIPTTQGLSDIIAASGGLDFSGNNYSQTTTFTANSIKRVVNIPILLVLKNLST